MFFRVAVFILFNSKIYFIHLNFALILNMEEAEHHCAYCGRIGKFFCTNCKTIYYCDIDCQKNDWKYHRTICLTSKTETKDAPEFLVSKTKELKLDDFERIKQIGEGNFSTICLVEHRETKKQFALKIVDKLKIKRIHKEGDILAEKHCLCKLENSNVTVKLITTFKDELNLYLLMEHLEGRELWEESRSFGLVSENLIRYYFYLIVKATIKIHDKHIVHRDLKVFIFLF